MDRQFAYQKIMIPDFVGMETDQIGIDSREHCFHPKKFDTYLPVKYNFNEIGFRTHSVKNFQSNAILVLGDSFTLGLGVNVADRFTDQIEQTMNHQVLNFSLNGGSNDWIARKLQQLLPLFNPRAVIVHYSFSHRRERPRPDWHDNERTECEPIYSPQQNYQNWYENYQNICQLTKNIFTIHSFIPNWHDTTIDYGTLMAPIPPVDVARDGFHYGPRTHRMLAVKFTNLLAA